MYGLINRLLNQTCAEENLIVRDQQCNSVRWGRLIHSGSGPSHHQGKRLDKSLCSLRMKTEKKMLSWKSIIDMIFVCTLGDKKKHPGQTLHH